MEDPGIIKPSADLQAFLDEVHLNRASVTLERRSWIKDQVLETYWRKLIEVRLEEGTDNQNMDDPLRASKSAGKSHEQVFEDPLSIDRQASQPEGNSESDQERFRIRHDGSWLPIDSVSFPSRINERPLSMRDGAFHGRLGTSTSSTPAAEAVRGPARTRPMTEGWMPS